MTTVDDCKRIMPGDFGYLEYLESEMERAYRLEQEAEQRRARDAGLAAVEGGLLGAEDETVIVAETISG